MHIPTANISEKVKDKAKITIGIKNEIMHVRSIGIFAFDLDPF